MDPADKPRCAGPSGAGRIAGRNAGRNAGRSAGKVPEKCQGKSRYSAAPTHRAYQATSPRVRYPSTRMGPWLPGGTLAAQGPRFALRLDRRFCPVSLLFRVALGGW
jgi:hypothetical protein